MRARARALIALVIFASVAPTRAEDLVVIVHLERRASLDIDTLAQIFLKQRRRWPGGDAIVPVNHESRSPVRADFARAVLAQSPQQLAVYWNRQYFLGVLPPATLASDEAVKRFVASEKRAIGYIRANALDASVRAALRLPESSPPPSRE
jgi:ABC-type phosphate transport system substrate-binding protein